MATQPLPAGTTLGQSYEYGIDVNVGTFAAPIWQTVRRISGWAPVYGKVTQDTSSYDDRGAPSEDVAARAFSGAFTVQANRSITTGLYLPEIEAFMAAAKGKRDAAILDVRFYHKPDSGTPHPTDAGRAQVTVELTRQNTGNADVETFSVSLTGKGEYTPIANPFTGWNDSPVPTISAATPSGAAAGALVTITGFGFLGATAVKFAAVSATVFTVVSATTIIVVVPAGTAGSAPITVTTPAGTNATPFPYTRA